MHNLNRIRHRLRPTMIGLAIVVLLAIPSLAAFASYSGNDPYDPAASGQPEMSIVADSEQSAANASDGGVRGILEPLTSPPRASYLGDIPYGPAAYGHPEIWMAAASGQSSAVAVTAGVGGMLGPTMAPAPLSYSGRGTFAPRTSEQPEPSVATGETCIGPDPYDPASGCHPERSLMSLAPSEQGIVHDMFARLDAGLVDAAATEFADTAVVDDRLDGKAYLGAAQIEVMLQSWRDEGCYYNVLQESTVTVAPDVDLVTREVEISNSSLIRGQGAIIAVVYGGQIQTLTVTGLRSPAARYGR